MTFWSSGAVSGAVLVKSQALGGMVRRPMGRSLRRQQHAPHKIELQRPGKHAGNRIAGLNGSNAVALAVGWPLDPKEA
jgi:hypothetical protein